jgi:thiamine pyrophosphate-dependent acetolactate synthase large subunit-like protein
MTEVMTRLDLTRRVLAHLTDEAVFAGIGNAGFDLFAAGDRPQNFYMFGSMGLASSIGLGYALSRPDERVVVLEGEGSVLMNLGTLATIARMHPPRYLLIIMDNGTYALTGSQRTAAAGVTDMAAMARGAGIPHVASPQNAEAFERTVTDALDATGPGVITVKIADGNSTARHEWDAVQLKRRFMAGVTR